MVQLSQSKLLHEFRCLGDGPDWICRKLLFSCQISYNLCIQKIIFQAVSLKLPDPHVCRVNERSWLPVVIKQKEKIAYFVAASFCILQLSDVCLDLSATAKLL